jgi:peptide/nickel transport system substrate-binding protein
MVRKLEDILDQEPPWFLIGYTFHLPMWRKTMKGTAFDLRQRAQWGRIDTAWVDK